jgi:nucleoside-diphosphate-sugar epimerase
MTETGPGAIVITGADGFVGSALVAHFAATGRPFIGVVRKPGGAAGANPHTAQIPDLSTASDTVLDDLVAGAAAIVHLAGRAHVLAEVAPDPAALYHAANVVVVERMAAAAVRAGVRRFVLASTIKVHGESTIPGRPFRVDDELNPRDAYARSKLEAEKSLHAIAAGTSLEPIVLRLPLVYGPRVKGNFLTLLDAVARGAPLPFGRIANRRDLLYAKLGNESLLPPMTLFLNSSLGRESFSQVNRFYGDGLNKLEPKDVEDMPCPVMPTLSRSEANELTRKLAELEGLSPSERVACIAEHSARYFD